jgi:hypothetical protein
MVTQIREGRPPRAAREEARPAHRGAADAGGLAVRDGPLTHRREHARPAQGALRSVDSRRGARSDRRALRRDPRADHHGNYLRRWGFTPQKPVRKA